MGQVRLVAFLLVPIALFGCTERTRTRQVGDAGLQCADHERLINGECVFVCARDPDCASGERCNLLLGKCEPKPPADDAGVVTYPCTTGATRCRADNSAVERCDENGVWVDEQACQSGGFCLNSQCLACQPNLATCEAATPTQVTVCLPDGSATRQVQCQTGGTCVQGECRECAPNTQRCSPDGKNVQTCQKTSDETLTWKWTNSGDNFDGTCITQQCTSGPPAKCVPPECVPGATRCASLTTQDICSQTGHWQGSLCSSQVGMGPYAECQSGVCVDECADAALLKSYFGCEYWTAVQDNSVDPLFKGGTQSGQGTADSDFAFVISNRSVNSATVQIYRWMNNAEQLLKTVTVDGKNAASKGVAVVKVPWQSIGTATAATSVTGKARYGYRITSSRPVTVYQFSPLDAVMKNQTLTTAQDCLFGFQCLDYPNASCTSAGKCKYTNVDVYSYSNDASLLLPAHDLTTQYVAVSHPHMVFANTSSSPPGLDFAGHVTIVGTQDNTTVTFKSSAKTVSGGGIPAIAKGGTQTLTLNRYDVIQIATDNLGNAYTECAANPFAQYAGTVSCRVDNDLSGSVINSDKPIAVFGGSACALMSHSAAACDHVEEQVFPFSTWGKTFVAVKSHPVRLTNNQFASTTQMSPDYYKVVASCPASQCPNGTLLTFNPAPSGLITAMNPNRCLTGTSIAANNCRLAGGSYMEFFSKGNFTLTGDQPISVAQVFAGQSATSGSAAQGDPSIILLPPAEQWRADYTIQTAPGLADNFLGIAIDDTKVASVAVDGTVLTGFTSVTSTYKAINYPVTNGVHTITVTAKTGATGAGAGVTVYGFDSYVSYGYTGGLDLGAIVSGIDPGG